MTLPQDPKTHGGHTTKYGGKITNQTTQQSSSPSSSEIKDIPIDSANIHKDDTFSSESSSYGEDSLTPVDEEDAKIANFGKVTEDQVTIGKTDSGVTFEVPKTHDMVRSLFDPTIRKSYCEVLITFSLIANFAIYKWFPTNELRITAFLVLYIFWRMGYNFGIGYVLRNQSNTKSLVTFAKDHQLFELKKKDSDYAWLQYVAQLEIKSKMGADYEIEKFPPEFNTWLLFRQFVDLILMQDFTTYMFLVWSCGVATQSTKSSFNFIDYCRFAFGSFLIVLNFWIKVDAHRVVKDYAWYWGDFFFLQEAELTFDGVFNLFPHPMYSVGYVGYYGFALITESYLVLFVSLFAHALQFVFLLWVEEPHMEKIYGSDDLDEDIKDSEYLLETSVNYLKPLIVFKNFKPIFRSSDLFLLIVTTTLILAPFSFEYLNSNVTFGFFIVALFSKVFQSLVVGLILANQSKDKSWTKLFLAHGLDNIAAFTNWQVIYNSLLVLTYAALASVSIRELLNGQFKAESTFVSFRVIVGVFLILLQCWTSSSILSSIGEFGWFYGDFFLTNYSKKTLTKSGIYRYLNNPERFLGIAGVWGLTLITYSKYLFALSVVWSLNITLFISFVEKPHMIKVYGEQQVLKNVSGVSLTLGKYVPKSAITIIDNINSNASSFLSGNFKKLRSQSHSVASEHRLQKASASLNDKYQISVDTLDKDHKFYLGQKTRLIVSWKAPKDHLYKDWIGLYKVVNTGSSRTFTRISSMGKWKPVNEIAYETQISSKDTEHTKSKTSGKLDFTDKLSGYEDGVYELRYYRGDSHDVLNISKPFEITISEYNGDPRDPEAMAVYLLDVINRISNKDNSSSNATTSYSIPSVNKDIEFSKVRDFGLLVRVIRKSTNFEISDELVKNLKSLRKICERIVKAKQILEELSTV